MTNITAYKPQVRAKDTEILNNRENLYKMFDQTPIPTDQLLINLPLYMRSSVVAKMLHFNEAYSRILHIPGAVMEFGVWWGQNLALFENLRAVYEPYNHARRIVGFDTFEGYPEASNKDKPSETLTVGGYTVSKDYIDYLEQILQIHENENVMSNIKKTALVKGDAGENIKKYLKDNPHTIIALACFDMALYEPTKQVLKAIEPHLIKGSVIVFDELNCAEFPGETEALRETIGFRNHKIERSRFLPDRTYLTIE